MRSIQVGTRGWGYRALLLSVGLLLIVALPAAARGASWTIQATPNGSGAEHSSLYDLSCDPLTTTACTAVGQQTVSGKTAPYAQYWNGSTWANQSAETPAGATAGELQANHCLSKTSCVAAGSYSTAAGTFSLVETWNGTSWTIQATPNPAEVAETRLKGISCKAITACIAVGYSLKEKGKESTKAAVVMRGNSGAWSLQTMPKPAGAVAYELTGVDCPTTTLCFAVGAYEESGGAKRAMVAKWNGTEWVLQPITNGIETKQSILLDVSCTDIKACIAVGGYRDASNVQMTYGIRWEGVGWTKVWTDNPSGSANSVLQNVNCSDRHFCVAVGDWLNAGVWQPLAQHSEGILEWSLDSVANPSGSSFTVLEGVECRITCITAGWYTEGGKNKTLAEVMNMTAWTQREVPNPTIQNTISGISCSFTVTCVAVGMSSSTARAYMGATIWEQMASPAIPGSISSQLRDVSCVPGVTFCMAGGVNELSSEKPYAAKWAGSGWTTYKLPLPSGSINGVVNDVSCTSSTACTAVGDYKKESTSFSYAARWNGSTWSVQSVPKSGTSFNVLSSVSCASSTSCVAVGYAGNSPLVVHWDGTSWSTKIYYIFGVTSGELFGVSCVSATSCMAVGWFADGVGGRHTQASTWNGTEWTSRMSPRPGFTQAQFEDVSCTSSTACIAVGAYEGAGPVAAAWNGTFWTMHDTGLTSGTLLGVSCTAATTCRAAGNKGNNNLAMTLP